jgi:hypothetical protein
MIRCKVPWMTRYCAVWLFLILLGLPVMAQEPFSDGFEDGLLDPWSLWIGTDSMVTAQVHSGAYALRLMHPNDNMPGIIVRDGFVAGRGVFEAWFWISNDYECNAMLAFQAADSADNYSVTCVPLDLDGQSTIVLRRIIADEESTLALVRGPGLLHTQEWFKIRVHRYTNGRINIFTTVRGVETLQASVIDTEITEARPFGLGGWGGVIIDDTRYDTLCCEGIVGDVNGDGAVEPSLGDIALLIDAKFISLTCDRIACISEADVNRSGGAEPVCSDISIGDISILIDYLFITGSSLGLSDCL